MAPDPEAPGLKSPAARCTGECCRQFVLWRDGVPFRDTPVEQPWARLALLREVREADDGTSYGVFGCVEFDEVTQRCQAYEARPDTCRNYPHGGDHNCGFCGAASSAEACGAALQRLVGR